MTDTVEITKSGAVATLMMNRPKAYNSFNSDLRSDLLAAVQSLEDDKDIRVVILCGSGPGFSAGADLREEFPVPISDQLDGEYKPALEAIHHSNKIYIAQVHGKAAGIGAGFAMACDMMCMGDDAAIYMAFAAIALVPDGGSVLQLTRALGPRRAMEVIVEGQALDAQTCVDAGLANKVFPSATLGADTMAWATSLATRAPLAVQGVKRLIRAVPPMTLGEAISAEGQEQNICQVSKDNKRGIQAFLAKEAPVFKGD